MTRALAIAALAFAARAGAEEPPLSAPAEVVVAGCTGLNAREIARLIALEVNVIASDLRSLPGFTVYLACSNEEQISITVEDPVTGKSLQRQIPAPRPGKPGGERMIALATSQLLRVSWMELLMATSAPTPMMTPAPSSDAVAAARVVAEKSLTPELGHPAPRVDLSVVLGAEWRDLTSPFLLGQIALRGAYHLSPHATLCVQLTGETGKADRAAGAVNAWGAFAGLGGGVTTSRLGPLGFDALAVVGVGYLSLSGSPTGAAVTPGIVGVAAFNARVALGPSLRFGGFHLAAEAEGSYTTPRAIGEVSHERSVVSGGFAVGAGLRAGWTFGAN